MIALLLASATCKSVSLDLVTANKAFRLNSLGLDSGAHYYFDCNISHPATLHMFLVNREEFHSIISSNSLIFSACMNLPFSFSRFNYSSFNSTRLSWEGEMLQKDVYIPLMLNCNFSNLTYSITYGFSNPNSLLDYREEDTSLFELTFGIIYLLVFLSWAWNSFKHPEFFIWIHVMFMLFYLFKSLSLAVNAYVWNQKKVTELKSIHPFIVKTNQFLEAFSHAFYLTLIGVALSGFGTYSQRFPSTEGGLYFFSSLLFTLSFVYDPSYTSILLVLFFTLSISVSFLIYFQLICRSIGMLFQIDEQLGTADEVLTQKLGLVKSFALRSGISFVLFLMVYSSLIASDTWASFKTAAFEALLLIASLYQSQVFWLKKGHVPQNCNEGLQEDFRPFNFHPLNIQDPVEEDLHLGAVIV